MNKESTMVMGEYKIDLVRCALRRVINLYFDLILAPIWSTFPINFMLYLDKKGSNLSSSVHSTVVSGFSYFMSSYQEDEKITSFYRKEDHGMYVEEEKGSYKVSRARKASLNGQKACLVGRTQWHNYAKILQ